MWSVAGASGGGATTLEVRQPLTVQLQRALGMTAKVCLVDVAVVGAGATSGSAAGAGELSSPSVASWGLDLLVLAVAAAAGGEGGAGEGGGAFSVHAVRVSSEEASWVGSSVAVKVGGVFGVCWRFVGPLSCLLLSVCPPLCVSRRALSVSLAR